MKASIDLSGVEVAGREDGMVAAMLELVLDSSAMVPVGVKKIGRVRHAWFVISLTVVPAKKWETAHKDWQ